MRETRPDPSGTLERWLDGYATRQRPFTDALIVILLMLAALLYRMLLPVENGLLFVTSFPAVALAALFTGFRGGLLATAIGMFFASWIFTQPYWVLNAETLRHSFWPNMVFLVDGVLVSLLIEAMRRFRLKYKAELAATSELLRQRRADEILQRRFHDIIESSDDAIISKSLDGIIESWNKGAERIFGYRADEVIGQPMAKLIPAERLSEEVEVQAKLSRGERISHYETQRLSKAGGYVEVSVTLSPIVDAQGAVCGISKIARDITQQKLAERQIEMFFKLLPDILCVGNYDGYFQRVNTGFTRCLGWSSDELLSHPWSYFVHPDDLAASHAAAQRLMAGEHVLDFEHRFRHKNGSWRLLSWIAGTDGRQTMFASARDVTAVREAESSLKTAKERAEQAGRIKASFLASMSHEIRTPLGGMLGMLELLSMSPLDAEQLATLSTAQNSGSALLRIVNDILDWSKIEEGKLDINPVPTVLKPLLLDVVNTYSRVASSKSLNLWSHVDSRLLHTYLVDPLRLSQVLNNFTSNAVKFTQRGEIEIRAELVEEREGADVVHFTVKDTGMGIAAGEQDRLFQNYAQASSDTARMYGGTGLGLAICRRLAEMMGGELSLVSMPQRGSTFGITLMLPRTELPPLSITPSLPDIKHRTIQPLFGSQEEPPLLLVVDDHPTNRDLLARQIKILGARARTAENGRIGLSLWRDGRFAMIISDCHMQDMDGYEMAKAIRRTERTEGRARTPIIAWTANALPEEVEHIRAVDMDELLVKPVELTQLRNMLARWLKPEAVESPPLLPPYRRLHQSCRRR